MNVIYITGSEQDRIEQYEETGSRGLDDYTFVFLSYKTGYIIRKFTRKFPSNAAAYEGAQILVETEESVGKILMLYQFYPKSDTVEESFHMLHGMFWPEAVKEAMLTFFEVL